MFFLRSGGCFKVMAWCRMHPVVFSVFGVFLSVSLARVILKILTCSHLQLCADSQVHHLFGGAGTGSALAGVKGSESLVGIQVRGFPLRCHPLLLDMSDTASLSSEVCPPLGFTS